MPQLQTERLAIRTFTFDLVRAALRDRAELARLLDARVSSEWPQPDFAEVLPFQAQRLERSPSDARWIGIILHAQDRLLIGDIGFRGFPNSEGLVELGYGIVPSYRGRGYATEAAQAMIEWALAQPDVRGIVAGCLITNNASARVLEKLGMLRTGIEESPEGPLIRWALPRR